MTDPAPLLPALPDIFDGFRLEIDPARERADVILDRAPLNVITMAEREQLRAVFEALDADARVRVIVLRAGGEHFSSGGEIRGFLDASPEHVSHLAWNIAAPARCRKPVIAASRGYCFGVGFELALACDFRLVSETCLYSLPEQRLGQIPGSGGAARLQKMVGITRAKDIVTRSRRIPGRQAYEWGVATDCVADGDLEAASASCPTAGVEPRDANASGYHRPGSRRLAFVPYAPSRRHRQHRTGTAEPYSCAGENSGRRAGGRHGRAPA